MDIKTAPAFHYRRGSASSERDFFDIPDEPVLAVVKRQLRRIRTWVVLAVLFLFFLWWRRTPPPPPPLPHINYDKVDWTRYAYSQYATSPTYLCNAVMVFEALKRLGSRAERVLFYPQEWDLIVENPDDRVSQLLLIAKNDYDVRVVPVEMEGIRSSEGSRESWDHSVSKFYAFGEAAYDRIIHLDSDITLLQSMDELFFLPPTQVAMPRAYWLLPDAKQLSSLLLVIEPSFREYHALMDSAQAAVYGQVEVNLTEHRFDMDLLNDRYSDSALVLPHRQYSLITGEFRAKDHRHYLGNDYEEWDTDKVLADAKLVHFSDWPLPKPWVMWPTEQMAQLQPRCKNNPGTVEESGCRDREVWKHLYDDFRKRRKDICRLLSFPAPV